MCTFRLQIKVDSTYVSSWFRDICIDFSYHLFSLDLIFPTLEIFFLLIFLIFASFFRYFFFPNFSHENQAISEIIYETYKNIILFNIRNIRNTRDNGSVWRLYGSLNGLLNSVYVVSAWWFEATRRIAFMSNTWEMDNGWSVDYRLTFKLQMTIIYWIQSLLINKSYLFCLCTAFF